MTSAPIKFKRVSICNELLYESILFIVDHKYWSDDDWIKSEYNYISKCQPYIIAFCNYTKLQCIRTSKTIIEHYKKTRICRFLFHFYYVDINLEPVKISVMCFGKKVDHFLLSRKLAQFENCHSSLFFMFISWSLGVENGVHKNICKAQHKSAAYFREEITSTDKT